MKKLFLTFAIAVILTACGNKTAKENNSTQETAGQEEVVVDETVIEFIDTTNVPVDTLVVDVVEIVEE